MLCVSILGSWHPAHDVRLAPCPTKRPGPASAARRSGPAAELRASGRASSPQLNAGRPFWRQAYRLSYLIPPLRPTTPARPSMAASPGCVATIRLARGTKGAAPWVPGGVSARIRSTQWVSGPQTPRRRAENEVASGRAECPDIVAGGAPARAPARTSLGLSPNSRRKARLKLEASSKQRSSEITNIGRFRLVSHKIRCASSRRWRWIYRAAPPEPSSIR